MDLRKINLGKKELYKDSINLKKTWKIKPPFYIFGIFFFIMLYFSISFLNVYRLFPPLYQDLMSFRSSLKEADLQKAGDDIIQITKKTERIKRAYRMVSVFRFVPFLGNYIKDGENAILFSEHSLKAAQIISDSLANHLDFLDKNDQQKDGGKTTQERIDFLLKDLPNVYPRLLEAQKELALARQSLEKIDPQRYPKNLKGKEIREGIVNFQREFFFLEESLRKFLPIVQDLPYFLGVDKPRRYLVLFQNDKELRPTGGFLTAYALMTVDKARIEPVFSNDIYNLDLRYKPNVDAPEEFRNYLKGVYIKSPKMYLRDMNWNPDFSLSMETFVKEVEKVGLQDIDGVIAVDTQFLVNVLEVIGEIGVPGFGNFSTKIEDRCRCPQVIYELESFADVEGPIVWDPITGRVVYRPPNSDNRKKIIGPLMNSILANVLGQPKEKMLPLFRAIFDSVFEKHVLFYFKDESKERRIKEAGMGGILNSFDGDYIFINDANLGGRKSNLYIVQEVEQEYNLLSDGSIVKRVDVIYKNPESYDGWLNSVLPNWVRIYVPKGSKLQKIEGLEGKKVYEDLDKTVFAGFFTLRPQGVVKVSLEYKLPFKISKDKSLELLIQKQAGKGKILHTVKVGKETKEFYLSRDQIIYLNF